MTLSLNKLAADIHQVSIEHGFWEKDRNFGEQLMLAVSELSEALEADRDGEPAYYREINGGKPEGVAVEIIDCIIRCFDTLCPMGVDIDSIMDEKIGYNRKRPYKHGRAY